MANIAGRLAALGAADVRKIQWEDAPNSGDAYDFIAARNGADEVRRLWRAAKAVNSRVETRLLLSFTTYSLSSLESLEFPPVEWTVENLIPAGALTLVVGRPKAGKSLFMIDLAASVAAGETFIDCATGQGPTVYVPAEDALSLVKSRLFTRLPSERRIPLYTLPADGSVDQSVRLDDAESMERLIRTVDELQPALLVLDPFRELYHKKENDADEMAALLRPLRQLAHESGTAIVMVHHRNKHATDASIATRGSSAIAGSVDVTMTLDTSGNDDEGFSPDKILTINVEGRYGPRQRLGARLRAGLRWESAAPSLGNDLNTAERILRYLESTGEQPTADELHGSMNLAKKTIQNALTVLAEREKVVRLGVGRRGEPYRYATPQLAIGTNTRTKLSASESVKQSIRPKAQIYIGKSGGLNQSCVSEFNTGK